MIYVRNQHLPPLLLAAVLPGLLIPAAPCAAADCNNNGIEDAVDIITGISDDFDRDGTPDECERLPGVRFVQRVDIPSSGFPSRVIAVDLDGDGRLDLGVADTRNDQVRVIWNEGQGVFSEAVSIASVDFLVSLTAADVDGDGDLDFAITSSFTDNVTIVKNRTQRQFGPPSVIPVGFGARSITAADFRGLGVPDLAVWDWGQRVAILLNDGLGQFPTIRHQALAAPGGARGLLSGDFDGDGDPDLVVGGVTLLTNDGTGEFSTSSIDGVSALAADFDGDGDLDLASLERVALNNGDGRFELRPPYRYIGPLGGGSRISAGDLDGDGLIDLAIGSELGCSPDCIAVLRNCGDGQFGLLGRFGQGVRNPRASADLTGDGRADIIGSAQDSDGRSTIAILLAEPGPFARDCNGNGVPDECDIASANSADANGNGTPDDCESVAFVDAAAGGNNDGTNWADAFTDLQDALALASHGFVSEIWVAAGTYRPAPPGGDRTATFLLSDAASVYGGFSGAEISRDQRDPDRHITILSGDLNGNDGPDFAETEENSHHVVTAEQLRIAPLLDGFVVRGGNALDALINGGGGGLLVRHASLRVANCLVIENQAQNGSGLFWRNGCDPKHQLELERCRFSGNRSTSQRDRSQLFLGGECRGSVEIRRCTLNGALFAQFMNCRISDSDLTAPIMTREARMSLLRCRILNVRASARGGTMNLTNCILLGPSARVSLNNAGESEVTNCTIVGGSLFGSETATFRVANTIAWDPPRSGGLGLRPFDVRGSLSVTHSLIEGGWPGEGNLDVDPMFVRNPGDGGDEDLGDLHLRHDSPAIDAGTNDVDLGGSPDDTAPVLDFDGRPRFLDDPATPDSGMGTPPIVDVGAYEFALDGDLDFDFDVDLGDLLALLACQRDGSASNSNDCRHADLDGDGDVDLADLITFQARFTGSR